MIDRIGSPVWLAALTVDPTISERVEAFAAQFGRLQDTLGDKLLPALLLALGERPAAAADNLSFAERLMAEVGRRICTV